MSDYNLTLQSNNVDLQSILDTINELPEAGGEQATPEISVSSNGLITAVAGAKTSTHQLTTQGAKTIIPSTSSQTAVAKNVYTTDAVTVSPIPDGYMVGNEISTQDNLIGELRTILSSKSSNNGGITPTGTLEIIQNGTYDVTNYASVEINVDTPINPSITIPLRITENGTYTAPDGIVGYTPVIVDVQTSGSDTTDNRHLYQRVEYIESAEKGTYPYIITDFCANNDSGVEVIASFSTLQDKIPMGSREDSNATRFYCTYPLSATSSYYGFNSGSNLSGSFAINTIYRCQTNFLGSRMAGIFDSNGVRKSGGLISATLTTQTAPVSIFGYHSAASVTVSSKREFKLYSARISQSFEVVREYIPCYRKSDNVAGVYEKFTGEFLTTPTGSFICGTEIDW